jgi:phosphatidylserine/phosphatidylglycerophosphate/cardiolipin synthase-like enzyme
MSFPRNKIIEGLLTLSIVGLCLLAPPTALGKIETHFNSTERLEKYVKGAFSAAVSRAKEGGEGTIDIMIFSFTSHNLANSLLRIARDFPTVKIRILGNLSQLFREPTSVMPDMENIASGKLDAYRRVAERRKYYIKNPEERKPAIESEFKQIVSEFRQKPLPNVEIKYKWFPSFSWNEKEGKATYDHFHPKSALLHHKSVVANGEILVTGSYNWSNYAETKNLENIMIISGPEDLKLITDFQAEFEAMWNDPNIAKSPAECRALKNKICAELEKQHKSRP